MDINPDLLAALLHLIGTASDAAVSNVTDRVVDLVILALVAAWFGRGGHGGTPPEDDHDPR